MVDVGPELHYLADAPWSLRLASVGACLTAANPVDQGLHTVRRVAAPTRPNVYYDCPCSGRASQYRCRTKGVMVALPCCVLPISKFEFRNIIDLTPTTLSKWAPLVWYSTATRITTGLVRYRQCESGRICTCAVRLPAFGRAAFCTARQTQDAYSATCLPSDGGRVPIQGQIGAGRVPVLIRRTNSAMAGP